MEIYKQDFSVCKKDDQSPVTHADIKSHKVIIQGLKSISNFPVLSEEGEVISWDIRKKWKQYWLVDPLDGTKEFIKKNDEFTINIALIENGVPVLGVVSAPALSKTYFGIQSLGAWVKDDNQAQRALNVNSLPELGWKVMISRSHANPKAIAFANQLPDAQIISIGSSLKFCAIAEGNADIYPRFGPTSEWDTAAAQAVLEAAGGKVVTLNLKQLQYNSKCSLINPYFVACADINPIWTNCLR